MADHTTTQREPLGEICPDGRLGGLQMSLTWTVHEYVDSVRLETESWPVVVVSSDIDPTRLGPQS